jgi:hypothetical protein
VIWVGVVSFIALQSIARNVAGSRYIYIPGDPMRYQPYTPPYNVDDGRVVALDDGTELYFHRSIRQYGDARDIDPIIYDFWEQRWGRYWGFIRPWLLLIALPGFLFILVYAVMWVIDGFGGP